MTTLVESLEWEENDCRRLAALCVHLVNVSSVADDTSYSRSRYRFRLRVSSFSPGDSDSDQQTIFVYDNDSRYEVDVVTGDETNLSSTKTVGRRV